VIAEIEAEGNHFLRVPKLPGQWPKMTSAASIKTQQDE